MNRQDRKINQPQLIQEQRDMNSYLEQLTNYRRMQREKQSSRRPWGAKKIITVDDLQKKIDHDTINRNAASGAGRSEMEKQGIRALDLTNQFRASEGNRPALAWNQPLHDIAMEHSKNMVNNYKNDMYFFNCSQECVSPDLFSRIILYFKANSA